MDLNESLMIHILVSDDKMNKSLHLNCFIISPECVFYCIVTTMSNYASSADRILRSIACNRACRGSTFIRRGEPPSCLPPVLGKIEADLLSSFLFVFMTRPAIGAP